MNTSDNLHKLNEQFERERLRLKQLDNMLFWMKQLKTSNTSEMLHERKALDDDLQQHSAKSFKLVHRVLCYWYELVALPSINEELSEKGSFFVKVGAVVCCALCSM